MTAFSQSTAQALALEVDGYVDQLCAVVAARARPLLAALRAGMVDPRRLRVARHSKRWARVSSRRRDHDLVMPLRSHARYTGPRSRLGARCVDETTARRAISGASRAVLIACSQIRRSIGSSCLTARSPGSTTAACLSDASARLNATTRAVQLGRSARIRSPFSDALGRVITARPMAFAEQRGRFLFPPPTRRGSVCFGRRLRRGSVCFAADFVAGRSVSAADFVAVGLFRPRDFVAGRLFRPPTSSGSVCFGRRLRRGS